jgi:hypothetical protein
MNRDEEFFPMQICSVCNKKIHDMDPVSALFTSDGQRSYCHPECENKTQQFARWKEEASWAYKPVRLTVADWKDCSSKKHVGVWQSVYITRRDDDIWCPDCGLKIARHEGVRCTHCGAGAIVVGFEPTKMVFTHHEPLYKLQLHCTERGETSSTFAIISGFTPVTVTSKNKLELVENKGESRMLEYRPREDVKRGLQV